MRNITLADIRKAIDEIKEHKQLLAEHQLDFCWAEVNQYGEIVNLGLNEDVYAVLLNLFPDSKIGELFGIPVYVSELEEEY